MIDECMKTSSFWCDYGPIIGVAFMILASWGAVFAKLAIEHWLWSIRFKRESSRRLADAMKRARGE